MHYYSAMLCILLCVAAAITKAIGNAIVVEELLSYYRPLQSLNDDLATSIGISYISIITVTISVNTVRVASASNVRAWIFFFWGGEGGGVGLLLKIYGLYQRRKRGRQHTLNN